MYLIPVRSPLFLFWFHSYALDCCLVNCLLFSFYSLFLIRHPVFFSPCYLDCRIVFASFVWASRLLLSSSTISQSGFHSIMNACISKIVICGCGG